MWARLSFSRLQRILPPWRATACVTSCSSSSPFGLRRHPPHRPLNLRSPAPLPLSTRLEQPTIVPGLVRQAQERAAAKDWNAAVALLERAVRINPVQSSYWASLGDVRYNAKDYDGAVEAYERAAELGAPMMGAYYSIYNIACCHALAGKKELAIAALQRAYDLGFPDYGHMVSDSDLASIREDPRVVEMLGLQDVSKMSRSEGWRHDLSILAAEVRRKGFNRRLYVNRIVTQEAFDAKVRELHDAIPSLTDGQIVLGMMKLMVFIDDGHSAVWDVGENPLFRTALPLRLFWFEEGLFVTAGAPEYKDLLGAQVEAFDGRATADVLAAMEPYNSRDRGNPMDSRVGQPYRVRRLALLHAAGLIRSPDRVTLTVRDLSGSIRDVTIEADPKEKDIWNTLPAPASWVTFASTLDSVPLYVQHMDRAQWFEYLAPQKTVYFQFNKVRNGDSETLDQFSKRLVAFVDQNDVEKLVIDMRWNNGGNTWLGQSLLLSLIGDKKINQRGRFFVIIGRRTFSAAQNMATYFERFTEATFVGEPTGSSPNFVGEEVPITLPYSKVMANISHLFWQSSWPQDQRIWLAPSIYIPPTFADFRAGRDPAMEAILAYREP